MAVGRAQRIGGSAVAAAVLASAPIAAETARADVRTRAAPTITCAAPDGEWHAANVALRCTASDPQGLDRPGDASFVLRTAVPAGDETATAATGRRKVCDTAGNCATAGPIPGNRVDRKAPEAILRQPADGKSYGLLARHGVRFRCGDEGSQISSCQGTLPEGTQVPTGVRSLGPHTFVVIATDRAGNRTKVRHEYRIEPVTLQG